MTDNAEQGFTGADVAALGSTIVGAIALILAVFLPARDIAGAFVVAAVALGLAIFAGARSRGRGVAWTARIGSTLGVLAIAVAVISDIMH